MKYCAIVFTSVLLSMAMVMAMATAEAGEIHQWKDANGQVHFGDRAPANTVSTVVKVKPNVYISPSIEALSKLVQRSEQVVMYSASWCGYCDKARSYFNSHGVAFSEYDIETSAKGQQDYQRLGAHGVPVILVGNQRLNGFSAEAFASIYKAL